MRKAGLHKRVIDVEVRKYGAMAWRHAAPNAPTWALSARRAISLVEEPFREDIQSLWKVA